MYTSPVIFALPQQGFMHKVFMLNFMTPVILTARAWATGAASPMPFYFLGVASVFLVLLFFAWVVFRITMPVIIERMSS
jgi:lipopolysaccharide transport system permease protein